RESHRVRDNPSDGRAPSSSQAEPRRHRSRFGRRRRRRTRQDRGTELRCHVGSCSSPPKAGSRPELSAERGRFSKAWEAPAGLHRGSRHRMRSLTKHGRSARDDTWLRGWSVVLLRTPPAAPAPMACEREETQEALPSEGTTATAASTATTIARRRLRRRLNERADTARITNRAVHQTVRIVRTAVLDRELDAPIARRQAWRVLIAARRRADTFSSTRRSQAVAGVLHEREPVEIG